MPPTTAPAPPPLALRPYRPATDAPLLRSWITSRAELVTWAGNGFSWPLDDAQLAAYATEPGRRTWTALTPAGDPVGHVSLAGSRLGRVLIAPAARGRGLGESLVTLALTAGFGELGLAAIDLGVWAHNTAALRIYQKLGFRVQRIIDAAEVVDGEPWTAYQMHLTAPDPRQ